MLSSFGSDAKKRNSRLKDYSIYCNCFLYYYHIDKFYCFLSDMLQSFFQFIAWDQQKKILKKIQNDVVLIRKQYESYMDKTDEEIQSHTQVFKKRIADGESLDDVMYEAFATVMQACRRMSWTSYPVKWDMRERNMIPYDVQLIWWIMLHKWYIAEMKTWEWKTLVAALPAYLNALTQKWVHVVTVNDYLASRDAEWMWHLYTRLGLTVWCVIKWVPPQQRESLYSCDITYVENAELWFDFLRDNLVVSMDKRNLLTRPLHYAIIDEVDSILVDEARTPLIISEPDNEPTDKYTYYAKIVKTLLPATGKKKVSKWFIQDLFESSKQDDQWKQEEKKSQEGDYYIDEKWRTATLSSAWIAKLESMLGVENLYSDLWFEEIHHIENALKAQAVFHKDKEYIVQDKKVVIIDEHTGRAMAWRRFSEWLHQAIEAKELVPIQKESKTLATVTYQNFFKNYQKLSGMTWTAMTEAEEFDNIYELETIAIPTNKPIIRVDHNDKVYFDQHTKRKKILEDIRFAHTMWQPILLWTSSIHTSEFVSQLLQKNSIVHTVLNAKYHEKEASIVANAWKESSVVVATNMAWRGTDIQLSSWLNKTIAANYASRIHNAKRKKDVEAANVLFGDKKPTDSFVWVVCHIFSEREREILLSALKTECKITEQNDELFITDGHKLSGWIFLKAVLNKKKKTQTDSYISLYVTDISVENVVDQQRLERESSRYVSKDLHFGLFILWTEKHESRRIDNQLRGRAWRQWDPWVSVFYVALDDEIMRKMWGDKIQSMARMLLPKEQLQELELKHSQFSSAIKRAQKQMEAWHFSIRKHLFEYDSVVDKQRQAMYAKRDQLLQKKETDAFDVIQDIGTFVPDVVGSLLNVRKNMHLKKADIQQKIQEEFGVTVDKNATIAEQKESIITSLNEKLDTVIELWDEAYNFLTQIYLRAIDKHRVEHIDTMHRLREKVGLMWYAQMDPLVVYKKEAYENYQTLQESIKRHTVHIVARTDFDTARQVDTLLDTVEQEADAKTMLAKLQDIAKNIQLTPQQQQRVMQQQKKIVHESSSDFEVFEDLWETTQSSSQPQVLDMSSTKKRRPNDKVTVKYKNGTMEYDVKYKKVQQDIEDKNCIIVG